MLNWLFFHSHPHTDFKVSDEQKERKTKNIVKPQIRPLTAEIALLIVDCDTPRKHFFAHLSP